MLFEPWATAHGAILTGQATLRQVLRMVEGVVPFDADAVQAAKLVNTALASISQAALVLGRRRPKQPDDKPPVA